MDPASLRKAAIEYRLSLGADGVTLERRLNDAAARIEQLEAALQWLMKQPWKSIDKDNMEFQVIVSCYVRDALLAALAGKSHT